MRGYVKIQELLHGPSILIPKNRTLPPELNNKRFGEHVYLDINGITMHYVKKGCDEHQSGPILLLLHGFLDFWYTWNNQIHYLGKDFCVVAPDLRGYGWTSKPTDPAKYRMVELVRDIKVLVEALNPGHRRKLVLVGHDWGGMIGFVFATLHEVLISSMVIINGMHPVAFRKQLLRSVTQMKMSWYLLPFRHPDVPEKFLIMNDFQFFDKIYAGSFSPKELNASKYMFSQQGALTAALNYYRAFNNDSDNLNAFPYRKINRTALILWGDTDAFLSSAIAEFNREWVMSSRVVYFSGVGHWPLRVCYSQVNSYIRQFAKNEKAHLQQRDPSKIPKDAKFCEESSEPSAGKISHSIPGVPHNVTFPTSLAE